MQMAEVAYDFFNAGVSFMVGSEADTHALSIPYHTILNDLLGNYQSYGGRDFAELIVNDTTWSSPVPRLVDENLPTGSDYSAVDLALIGQLARSVNSLAAELIGIPNFAQPGNPVYEAWFNTGQFGLSSCIDIVAFAQNIVYQFQGAGGDDDDGSTNQYATIAADAQGIESAVTQDGNSSGQSCVVIDYNNPNPAATQNYGIAIHGSSGGVSQEVYDATSFATTAAPNWATFIYGISGN